ncbi:MAG: hypothetical protein Q8O45_12075 [Desulfurivibrionaceae bacterium]|jgi:hypothetical protein|nr:hypothetical protein [Desulfurivibrionaceae bacterium]
METQNQKINYFFVSNAHPYETFLLLFCVHPEKKGRCFCDAGSRGQGNRIQVPSLEIRTEGGIALSRGKKTLTQQSG